MHNRSIGLGTDINGLVKGPVPSSVTYTTNLPNARQPTRNGTTTTMALPTTECYLISCRQSKPAPNPDGKTVYDALNKSANLFVEMWEKCELLRNLDQNGRCLKPREGHGHEGEPCQCRLGSDGVCQYHG